MAPTLRVTTRPLLHYKGMNRVAPRDVYIFLSLHLVFRKGERGICKRTGTALESNFLLIYVKFSSRDFR